MADIIPIVIIVVVAIALVCVYFFSGFYKRVHIETSGTGSNCEEEWTTHHGRSVSCDTEYADDYPEPDLDEYYDSAEDRYFDQLYEQYEDKMIEWYEQNGY